MPLDGLAAIAIELTSICDKHTLCAACGHQDERISPHLRKGHMDFELLRSIRAELSPAVRVAYHKDGDPVAYPRLGEALALFAGFSSTLVTHGERLAEKADEIIGNCTAVTVSVFPKDPDRERQLAALRAFLAKKGDRGPMVAVKVVGTLRDEEAAAYADLGVPMIHRLLHLPEGTFGHRRGSPTIPEDLVCWDLMHRPAIDWSGAVFACARLDPDQLSFLGRIPPFTLEQLWNGERRAKWVRAHLEGRRQAAEPCVKCSFYGVPTG
jgi:hypothetical protein